MNPRNPALERPLLALAAAVHALIVCAAPVHAQPDAPPCIIRNIRIVDVEAGRLLPARTVMIADGRIERILDGDSAPREASPAGATVVDGSNLFLLPGLFDAHVHYVDPQTFGRLMVANGVTFVRDLGGTTAQVIEVRDQLARGDLLGPEMIVTGAIIDGVPPVWPFSEPCETPEQARAAVRKLHGAGVDQIKVYSLLKKEVYEAAVEEAHAVGLKAVGHIPNSATLDDAVRLKQDSVEHLMGFEKVIAGLVPKKPRGEGGRESMWAGFSAWGRFNEVDKEALAAELARFADTGMVHTPTLVVMHGIGRIADEDSKDDPMLEYAPASLRGFWETGMYDDFAHFAAMALPGMQGMVAAMHKAGLPMMVGTDLANPYVFAGFAVHEEMALLQGAGIPAADVLRAATIVPARFCGVGDRLGSVEPGTTASLLLVRANPLEDVRNAAQIEAVFLKGRHYDRAALDGLLAEARDLVKSGATAPVAADEIKLELPGEVVRRGRYAAKFGQFNAGTEDFLITRTPDGYHLMVHSRPMGGFQQPSILTAHADASHALRSAVWKQLTDPPLEVTYTVEGGGEGRENEGGGGEAAPAMLKAVAVRGDAPPETQIIPLPAAPVISGPVYAFDYFAIHTVGLAPGETKAFEAVGFGFPSWQASTSPMEFTRLEDTRLPRPPHAGGAEGEDIPVRHYRSTLTTPMGAFKGETWTDEAGVVLKSVTTMPFGVLSIQLVE